MAKVVPGPLTLGAIPRARGTFYLRSSPNGVVAQRWPRKRPGGPKTPYDFYRQKEFAYAAQWASSPEPLAQQTAVEMTRGTQQVPRDFLMMCSYGTAYELVMPDGRVLEVARHMTNNPQYMLDLITEDVGSMIWRADEGWIKVPGSAYEGLVLTWANGQPQWQPPAGGSGGLGNDLQWWSQAPVGSTNDSKATQAMIFNVTDDMQVAGLCSSVLGYDGRTFKLSLAKLDNHNSGGEITAIYQTPEITVANCVSGRAYTLSADLDDVIALAAGEAWATLTTRTDGSGSDDPRVQTSNGLNNAVNWPAQRVAYARTGTNDPGIGTGWDSYNSTFAGGQCTGMRWSLPTGA